MTNDISRSDKKRASIVEAAIAEFHANGFPGTSMDVIAATAGVSKRTVYNHFKSKDELFSAISSEACRRVRELPVPAYRRDDSLAEQLVHIATSILDLVSSPEFLRLVRVTVAERVRRPEVAAEAFAELEKGEFGSTAWLRAAASDGTLVIEDAAAANKRFAALIKEFALWPQLFGFRPALNEAERRVVIDEAVAMFLARYGR